MVGTGPVFDAATAEKLTQEPWRSLPITDSVAGVRGCNGLRRSGFRVLGDLAPLTQDHCLGFRGLGMVTLALLQDGVAKALAQPIHTSQVGPGAQAQRGDTAPETLADRVERGETPIFDDATAALLRAVPWRYQQITGAMVGSRAANRLRRERYLVFGDLASLSEDRFLGFNAVGPSSLEALRNGVRSGRDGG